jgi:predicted homoserine dehydrogenase-like protein
MAPVSEIRVGVAGTGFVSRHFAMAFNGRQGLSVSNVLTRRPLADIADHPAAPVATNCADELIDRCDVVFECTGDAVAAADLINRALAAGRPVVTSNPEFHVTAGSFFVGRGVVTEHEGDQPGALASMHRFATDMGFRPLAYCNIKGFRNYAPTLDDMVYWARKQNLSLPMVTAATDGTKLQVEQALVANYLGTDIACPGLLGPDDPDYRQAGLRLAEAAHELRRPISDYVLSAGAPHGVFIMAEHDDDQHPALAYLKMGEGPYYLLLRHQIFCHLEVARTIRGVAEGAGILMDNSARPRINVAALAKRAVSAGTRVPKGIGSFDFRGIAVRISDHPGALPIGLMEQAVVIRNLEPGQVVTFDDVEIPDTLALKAWTWARAEAIRPGS